MGTASGGGQWELRVPGGDIWFPWMISSPASLSPAADYPYASHWDPSRVSDHLYLLSLSRALLPGIEALSFWQPSKGVWAGRQPLVSGSPLLRCLHFILWRWEAIMVKYVLERGRTGWEEGDEWGDSECGGDEVRAWPGVRSVFYLGHLWCGVVTAPFSGLLPVKSVWISKAWNMVSKKVCSKLSKIIVFNFSVFIFNWFNFF